MLHMPELAEVEFFRKQWQPGIGKRIRHVHVHEDKKVFQEGCAGVLQVLKGERIEASYTSGKQMLFRIGKQHWLGVHLGMSGRLATAYRSYEPSKHDHLILYTQETALIYEDPRLFGRIRYHSGVNEPDWWQALAPDILGPVFTRGYLKEILTRHARQPIKSLLLNQAYFPGIGNWMADEVCWRCRLHPRTLAGELTDERGRELWKALRKCCRDALRVIGSDWSTPPNDWLFNHRWRDGGHCPRCDQPLIREQVGGRTTCWCVSCLKH